MFFDTIGQDVRYAFRTFRHNPGFAAFSILIIGLGVGASSTIFSAVNGLLVLPCLSRIPGTWSGFTIWPTTVSRSGISRWDITWICGE
jgi:hypothetical protein